MPKNIRPIRVEGNFAYVTLTQGYVAKIDAVSVKLVEGRNWCARVKKRADGSVRSVYPVTRIDGKSVAMHNILMSPQDGMVVDHVDCDGLNNTLQNMRIATIKENTRNSRTYVNSTTGVKGVHFNKQDKVWQAHIRLNGKRIHLGSFRSLDEAKEKYRIESKKMFGDFARTL